MPTQNATTALLSEIDAAGVSVRAVCRAAGVDPALVSRWKSGRVEPRMSTLQRLRDALAQVAQT